ncbi:phosphotransferase [Streptomyces sp. WMMC500]|uniref:aminoglycoside phosphotransferase family protein n=1 Tax=Streptomyces sp. WMMC500 TaxID=3015154 RepID=UPI00248CAF06|nr:aminoglycoside phosphotransferase family protein [Streptomyces sp. WMMC500]WBB62252.1 phosphotransferase [Streptomyces sp. WMMC500]
MDDPARSPDLFPPGLPVLTEMRRHASGRAWLAELPALVEKLRTRWSLRFGAPFPGGSCSWVAPAHLPDGTAAVFKVTWPHREAAGEGEGLRIWDGRGAVRLLGHDPEHYALLLERCRPGTELGAADELGAEHRLRLGAGVLRELWSAPVPRDCGLERVADVCAEWADLVEERMERLRPGYDAGLVAHGARLLRELPGGAVREVVVHGDFNPGNVLAADRRPWLAIDAKPMTGDPGYDPFPLLEQIDDPFAAADPPRTVAARLALLADELGEDAGRLAAWAVARRVETALWSAEHGDVAGGAEVMGEARLLADVAGV